MVFLSKIHFNVCTFCGMGCWCCDSFGFLGQSIELFWYCLQGVCQNAWPFHDCIMLSILNDDCIYIFWSSWSMPHSQSFIVNLMEKVSVLRLFLPTILYLIAKSWVCNDTTQLLKCLESNQKLGLLLLNFIPLFLCFRQNWLIQ